MQKGLRHGDPLTPFLFLTAVEGLADLVEKATMEGCLKVFKVMDNKNVPLLQFSDDTIFICHWGS